MTKSKAVTGEGTAPRVVETSYLQGELERAREALAARDSVVMELARELNAVKAQRNELLDALGATNVDEALILIERGKAQQAEGRAQ